MSVFREFLLSNKHILEKLSKDDRQVFLNEAIEFEYKDSEILFELLTSFEKKGQLK